MFPSLFDYSNEDIKLNGLINENEDSLRESFKTKFITLEKTLEVIASGLKEAKKQKLKPVIYIWNIAGYINTCSFDLAVTGESLMFEHDAWKKRYYSRMAAVNIYEASMDIPNMVGKEFRVQAQGLPGGDEFISELGTKVKKVNKFKSNHASWLKDIRLCCAAHRDQELSEQLRVVFEISPTKVLKVMAEFDSLLNELGIVLQSGMNLLPKRKNA